MKNKLKIFTYLILNLCVSICFGQNKDIEKIKNTSWNQEQIQHGILWKSKHFQFLFTGKQFINIIEIDLNDKNLKIEFICKKNVLFKTSESAKKNKAIIGINGSFFNIDKSRGVCFLKIKNQHINKTITNDSIWFYNDKGGLAFNFFEKTKIIFKKDYKSWENASYSNILSTGPVLIQNQRICPWIKYDLNHARTAIGIRENKLILLTVDGNTFQSRGITINDLAKIMYALGCENALNLDGGHSSTLWIKNKGVINHPNANKAFDSFGESKVANAILILNNDKP